MTQDWDIRSRSSVCARTGKAFADGQRYVSKLTFGPEGYVREDVAEEAWDSAMAEGALSVWRSTIEFPPPPAEEPLKKETAESLLRQLMEQEDPANRNAIYILAVMLERRRIFAERDVQKREDGVKIRVYEHRKTSEMFLIPDPELRLAELTHVQEEVIALLGGRSRAEHAPAQEAAPAAESSEAGD